MLPILLRDFTVRKGRAHYTVTLRAVGQEPVGFQTDANLGQIMSGFSVLFNGIQVMAQGGTMREPALLRGKTTLTTFRVEPLTVLPYRWRLVMATERYSFTCNLDRSLESVIAGLSAAMRFFGQKAGVVAVFDEVTYNHDRAGEAGLLEGHA